jgi:hypothetical protein
MEDFMIILYVAIVVASIIMGALALGLIELGKLIDKTPDIQELKKERVRTDEDKQSLYSPKKSSRLLAIAFSFVFIVGVIIVLLASGSKILLILGGVTMFAGLLFGTGASMIGMVIYRTMQKNMNKFNAGEAIGNG